MKYTPSVEKYIARFPKSKELSERARKILPNGVTLYARMYKPFLLFIDRAEGSHKWDVDGYDYIDYFGGHGGLLLGHSHPTLLEAVNRQIGRGVNLASSHLLEVEWAEMVQRLIPSAERVTFTNSGTEANMLAVRLARAFTGREKIVRFRGQNAGWYDDVMIGMFPPYDVPDTAGLLPDVYKKSIAIPPNDEEALDEALRGRDVALLMVEAMGTLSGQVGYKPGFHHTLRELSRKYGTLLLYDEVVTAFRYAPGGVQSVQGIRPDLTTLGKNLSGCLPSTGAVTGRADIFALMDVKEDDPQWNRYRRVVQKGTHNGNPLCAAAGIATLKMLSSGELQKRAQEMAVLLQQGLRRVMAQKNVDGCAWGEAGTCHLYFGPCNLRENCQQVVCLNAVKTRPPEPAQALAMNWILNGVQTTALGMDFYLSCVHTEEDIRKTIEAFERSLSTMLEEGTL